MKTQKLKRMMSLFLAALICVTTLVGFGTTAYAAEETDEVCLVSFPRDGDANYGGEWGHGSFNFMNGWFAQTSRYTTVRAMGSYDGNICYCIEPGVPQESGDRYTKKGENFWDNYPSSYNHTISPDDIKLFIGRIFQYGYTGTISTSWRSQNEGGDKLAHAVATQLLVWETIVGERDADFNKVGTGGKDAICDQVSTGQIQLFWLCFHNFSERRDQLRQLDRFSDLILRHAEELSYDFSRVVPLAIVAKGFNCRISLSTAVSCIQQRFIRLAAFDNGQILPPQKICCNRNADGALVVDGHDRCGNIRPARQLCRRCAVMPGQDFKFIRSCNGTHQNPLIQTILLQFFRKGFQLGVGVGMKANVSGIERV